MKVKKRDGTLEEYNVNKIITAVDKAFKSCGQKGITVNFVKVINDFTTRLERNHEEITVEEIQNEVESHLVKYCPYDVAKSYILYREKHKEARFIKERLDYMNKYSQSNDNAASSSETDANANVSIKNVANLEGEVYKTTNRIIQRQRMKEQLKKDFPEVAEQYEKDINNHIIYIHDEASTPVPKHYCMAVSMYPLLVNGTSTMDGLKTTPPKNLDSFCGQFINLAFLLSAQCKGAVGFGEFFNFFDWACVKEWGEQYVNLKNIQTTILETKSSTIEDRIKQAFQNIVYSINQPASNRGFQSPFLNFNYFDKYYWHSLFDNFRFPDGSKPKWERVSYLQKLFMKWFNRERTKTMLTYPVESACLLNNGVDYVDEEYKNFIAEMWSEGHSFFVYTSDNADSVASCCRLRNDVKLFTSTTGLTGIEVGSCNVITLNLNRILQNYCNTYSSHIAKEDKKEHSLIEDWKEHNRAEGFQYYLTDILERVYKYHVAYKNILYDWESKGMITACNAGYIHMNKLYSTYGINGLNEAAEFLGLEVSNNEEYKELCTCILNIIREFIEAHNSKKYMLNLEQVPAETLGVKNYNWDKEDGYVVNKNKNLYNSYIYDAHNPDTSVLDKLELQGGEIAKALSGGQACHINLEEHLSKEQYLKLMDFAIKKGCNYFTFNIPNTSCDSCGIIYKQPLHECPNCGSKELTYWTRVIGFLRPTKTFSAERQIEEKQRIYTKRINI